MHIPLIDTNSSTKFIETNLNISFKMNMIKIKDASENKSLNDALNILNASFGTPFSFSASDKLLSEIRRNMLIPLC